MARTLPGPCYRSPSSPCHRQPSCSCRQVSSTSFRPSAYVSTQDSGLASALQLIWHDPLAANRHSCWRALDPHHTWNQGAMVSFSNAEQRNRACSEAKVMIIHVPECIMCNANDICRNTGRSSLQDLPPLLLKDATATSFAS